MIIDSGNRIIFDGNGIAEEFPYSFVVTKDTDVKVAISDNETGTVQELVSDYFVDVTASKVIYPGYSPGQEPADEDRPPILPVGKKLIVYRKLDITQESDLGNKFPFNSIERMVDKNCILLQQVKDSLDRSLTLPVSTPIGFATNLPAPIPNTSFRVNGDGTGYETTLDPAVVVPVVEGLKADVETIKEETISAKEDAESAATTAAKKAADEAVANVQTELHTVLTTAEGYKDTAVQSANTATSAATTAAKKAADEAVANVQTELHTVLTTAEGYKNAASTSATNASNSAMQAGNYLSSANAAATSASNSATTATGAVDTIEGYMTTIDSQVATATEAASNASQSATTATNAVANAQAELDNLVATAESYKDTAVQSAATAEGYKNAANTSAANASQSATTATAAAAEATMASSPATNAATTATTASNNANTKANAAAQSASAAAQSAADAAASAGGDFIPGSQKGEPNGVATLNAYGLIPSEQLPSYVDDIIEVSSLPPKGETGKIYVITNSSASTYNHQFRWSGTSFIDISFQLNFATQAQAEAGADNTTVVSPLRVKQAIAKQVQPQIDSINTALGSYVLTSTYDTNNTALNNSISTKLSIEGAKSIYVAKTDLTTTLGGYYTKEQVDSKVNTKADKTQLITANKDYFLQRSTSYKVGDTLEVASLGHNYYVRCVQAGTTARTEPAYTTANVGGGNS